MNAVLTFQDTTFDVVDIHNAPWLRAYQIGSALGFSQPDAAVAKLYSRNADEFTEEMTQVLDLPTAGGVQQVRVFSLRGCHLLGMLARTAIAKAFRHWVLDVLEGRVAPQQAGQMTHPQRLAYFREWRILLKEIKRNTERGMREALYEQLRFVSRIVGMRTPPLTDIGRTVDQMELPQ